MMDALGGDEESIDNSILIAERCDIKFETDDYRLPKIDGDINFDGIREVSDKSLEDKINCGFINKNDKPLYKERINHEIGIIEKWDLKDISLSSLTLLIMQKIIKFQLVQAEEVQQEVL